MIHVSQLSLIKKKKNREYTLLKEISLEIPTAKITLFLGKSGSGKTSVLRCLSHIEKKYQGKILYRGQPISTLSPKERCQLIGFVPQSYALFPFMTVLENCAHPLRTILGLSKQDAYKKVEEKIWSLGMENLISFYPHELSGGQQQRTSILRALLLNPDFLLLDEPTSALDPENTNLLIQILQRLRQEGKGIVISSQDMLFAQKICEHVYFLEQGKVVESYVFNAKERVLSDESQLGRFFNATRFSQEISEPVLTT